MRDLTIEERKLVECLLKDCPGYQFNLDKLKVVEMNDGGMGSLMFVNPSHPDQKRSLGKYIIEKNFKDVDGIILSVALDVDKEGNLFELDIWKMDFSPIIKIPNC